MPPLRQHMIAALQLSGKSERPQQSYVREVRLLAQFYHTSPDRLSEQELQRYVLHRKNVDGLAPASMRICYSGIRFFSQHVLQRDWSTLSLLRAQTTHRLPAVLSVEEVKRLLTSATPLHNQVYFTTVYSLGLRLHEALFLQVSDIDGPRLQVRVHRGKGAKDRYVPLPEETLALLRTSWNTHRHPTWLFPATGREHTQSPTAPAPMRRSSVQGAFRTATQRAGIAKMGVAIHTLRNASTYCYTSLRRLDFPCLAIRGCPEPSPAAHPTQCWGSLRAMMCVRSLATRLVAPGPGHRGLPRWCLGVV